MELVSLIIERQVAKQMRNDGWLFDWSMASSSLSQKIGCVIDGEVQGLVEFERVPSDLYNIIYLIELAPWNVGKMKRHANVAGILFAHVARDSFVAGFDGFVLFYSKTILVEHYINKYGARDIGGNRLVFDTDASKKLIKEFLGGEDDA